MITLHFDRNVKCRIAESFDELTPEQFIKVASFVFSGGDELMLQVRALKILSGFGLITWLLLKPESIKRSLVYVSWLFEPPKFTKQLLPKYKGYYGPTSEFDNLRMKEFHFSEMFYSDVIASVPDALDKLVSVLYRIPKKRYDKKRDPDGDIRTPFNHNELDFHAKKMATWPEAVKQAVFLWYDSCRQELIRNNDWVFKKPSTSDFKSEFDTGLYGTMRSLAGEKLGSIEKIESMYVHTAMLEIGLIREEQTYYEEKIKAAGK
jgi:hypothetical protein